MVKTIHIWPGFWAQLGITGGIYAFMGLWGVPYLQNTFDLSREQSALYMTVMLLAFALGSLFFGWFSDRLGRRKPVLIGGVLLYIAALLVIIFIPWTPGPVGFFLFGILGFFGSVFVVTFACAKETIDPNLAGMSVSIVNTGAFIGTTIIQPLFGWVLDLGWDGTMAGEVRRYSAARLPQGPFCFTGFCCHRPFGGLAGKGNLLHQSCAGNQPPAIICPKAFFRHTGTHCQFIISELVALAKLHQNAGSGFGVQKGNFGAAGTDPGLLIDELDTLFFQFSQGFVDIFNPESHMLDALAPFLDIFGHGAVRRSGLQQLDFAFAHRKKGRGDFLLGDGLRTFKIQPQYPDQKSLPASMLFTAIPRWSIFRIFISRSSLFSIWLKRKRCTSVNFCFADVSSRTSSGSEMVDCVSDQGRSDLETGGVAALRRGFPNRENEELERKMPFPG